MTLYRNSMIKDAVFGSVSHVQKFWVSGRPNMQKLGLVVSALLISGIITTGVFVLTAKGDISVLKQRILGEVHLSTGNFSARTVSELNQLSWENGLDILAALDTVNSRLNEIKSISDANADKLTKSQAALKEDVRQLQLLLNDRNLLLKSARNLKTTKLYTPVYQEYLKETMRQASVYLPQKDPSTRQG